MRIPRGFIVYDKSITSLELVKKCLMVHEDLDIIVTNEPIYLLGSLYREGKVVLERKFFVIGRNSLVLEKDLCGLPYIKVELDAWGECLVVKSPRVIMYEVAP